MKGATAFKQVPEALQQVYHIFFQKIADPLLSYLDMPERET